MSAESSESITGEPMRSSSPPVSPDQARQLTELATRLKEGGPVAQERPKRSRLTSEQASAKATAYWATLGPIERRIRTLSARIGVGKAAERELAELLEQLAERQQDDAADGGQP
jgi:hypothetical protein